MTSTEHHLEIRRSEEIDLDELAGFDLDAVWQLISTAEGWATWLVDDAQLQIAPGSSGVTRDEGRERIVHVHTVVDRRRVGFSWWDRDEPGTTSYVELELVELVELDSHRARIDITERFTGRAAMASASGRVTGLRWEARLLLLCLMAMPALVKA